MKMKFNLRKELSKGLAMVFLAVLLYGVVIAYAIIEAGK